MLVSLKEYAAKNGIEPATARQKALRGGYYTAKKIGNQWVIDDEEPNTDQRITCGKYTKKTEWPTR